MANVYKRISKSIHRFKGRKIGFGDTLIAEEWEIQSFLDSYEQVKKVSEDDLEEFKVTMLDKRYPLIKKKSEEELNEKADNYSIKRLQGKYYVIDRNGNKQHEEGVKKKEAEKLLFEKIHL